MPPQRHGREAKKLADARMRALMRKYRIVFAGPLKRSDWPEQHAHLFEQVRDIQFIEYDEYCESPGRSRALINEMKRRTVELTQAARKDRKDGVNEATLRDIEKRVLDKFGTQIKCQTCRKYLWLSEFAAYPNDPFEKERLRQRRAEILLCQCPPDARIAHPLADKEDGFFFSNQSDPLILYDPREKLQEQGVKRRKPDRVIGLSDTGSIRYHSNSDIAQGLRHDPFPGRNLLYPFLVLEAKPEYGSPGFEAIEMQTAFPIRSCLMLQEDLRLSSEEDLKPLLWFLSYQGDEWRVAACVVHEGAYVVIDLWMGRTTSADGALQLLLIIDFICDWARNVFRFEVLRCLAGGMQNLKQSFCRQPSCDTYASRFSREPQDSSYIRAPPIDWPELEQRPTINDLTETSSIVDGLTLEDADMADSAGEDNVAEQEAAEIIDIEALDLRDSTASHSLLTWASAPLIPGVTVRHANLCLFEFHHLSIPDELDEARKVLTLWRGYRGETIETIAEAILQCFAIDCEQAICTTSSWIGQLRNEWLREHSRTDTMDRYPVWACVGFQSYFRRDWQIVREMQCVSCTTSGLVVLQTLSGVRAGQNHARNSQFKQMDLSTSDACTSFRSLTGRGAVVAAMRSRLMTLTRPPERVGPTGKYRRWEETISPGIARLFSVLAPDARRRQQVSDLVDSGSLLVEVSEQPLAREPAISFEGDHRGTLVRRRQHGPGMPSEWCLIIFSDIDFEDIEVIKACYRSIREHQVYYSLGDDDDGYRTEIVGDLLPVVADG